MNWTELLPYIRKGNQSGNLFVSRITVPDELGPYLVGMANASGGSIVVGMDLRNYHLFGTSIDQGWVDQLLGDHCFPVLSCHVAQIARGDKNLALITVPEGIEKPYFYKRQSYSIDPQNLSLNAEQTLPSVPSAPVAVATSTVQPSSVQPASVSVSVSEQVVEAVLLAEPVAQVQVDVSAHESPLSVSETYSEMMIQATPMMSEQVMQAARKSLKVDGLNRRQKKALTYLQKRQSIRNKKYRELYGVSHKTAHIELVDLLAKHIVVQQGAGRSTCYVLNHEQLALV